MKSSGFVDGNGNKRVDAGEQFQVVWKVANGATKTASALVLASGSGASKCPSTIAAGATITCTTSRTVGQSDIDAGSVALSARATGSIGGAKSSTAWVSASKGIKAVAALRVTQRYNLTQDADGSGGVSVGDTIGFVYDVSNSGNVTLTTPTVTSRLLRDRGLNVTCRSGSLKPNASGQSIRCWSPGFRVKAPQGANGKIVNTAVVSARAKGGTSTATTVSTLVISPIGSRVRPTPTQPVKPPKANRPPQAPRIPVPKPKPGISLVSRISHVTDEYAMNGVTDVGDKVSFQFVVTNSGKLPLSQLSVTDGLLAKQSIRVVCPSTAIAPGQSLTCSGEKPYVVTRKDFASGSLTTVSVARATVDATGKTIGVRVKLSRPLAVKLDETLGSSALAMTGSSSVPVLSISGGLLVLLGSGLLTAATRRRRPQAAQD